MTEAKNFIAVTDAEVWEAGERRVLVTPFENACRDHIQVITPEGGPLQMPSQAGRKASGKPELSMMRGYSGSIAAHAQKRIAWLFSRFAFFQAGARSAPQR